jgi:hypothetical protein
VQKKLNVKRFYVGKKIQNVTYFGLEVLNNYISFCKEFVKKAFKIWSWDPGSGIPDPGVKKAADPGS